jgi:hypothetical protein
MSRFIFTFFSLVAVAVVVIAVIGDPRSWSEILDGSLHITTHKVSQVTGNEEGSGITGSDLGFPIQWNDKLHFLFGDSRDTPPNNFVRVPNGYDAIAVGPVNWDSKHDRCLVAGVEKPDDPPRGCVKLTFAAADSHFLPVRLSEEPNGTSHRLGVFETPVSGVASGVAMYVFFTLRTQKSVVCPRDDGCALGDDTVPAGGRSVLARSTDGTTFSKVADVSTAKFQWPVAVVRDIRTIPGLADQIGLPGFTGQVAIVFAAGREDYRFRRGFPFLAVVPLQDLSDMKRWRYFMGLLPSGQPSFTGDNSGLNNELNAVPLPPFGHERAAGRGQPPYHQCVGEFSAAYIEPWKKWAMLYACNDVRNDGFNKDNVRGIYLRIANTPWGPWSGPKLIFRPSEGYCYFMYSANPCPSGAPNPNDLGMKDEKGTLFWGGEYAPMLLPTYTTVEGDTTNLYFLMSTWNPYQVVLMRTRITPRSSYRIFDVFRGLSRQQ